MNMDGNMYSTGEKCWSHPPANQDVRLTFDLCLCTKMPNVSNKKAFIILYTLDFPGVETRE